MRGSCGTIFRFGKTQRGASGGAVDRARRDHLGAQDVPAQKAEEDLRRLLEDLVLHRRPVGLLEVVARHDADGTSCGAAIFAGTAALIPFLLSLAFGHAVLKIGFFIMLGIMAFALSVAPAIRAWEAHSSHWLNDGAPWRSR